MMKKDDHKEGKKGRKKLTLFFFLSIFFVSSFRTIRTKISTHRCAVRNPEKRWHLAFGKTCGPGVARSCGTLAGWGALISTPLF